MPKVHHKTLLIFSKEIRQRPIFIMAQEFKVTSIYQVQIVPKMRKILVIHYKYKITNLFKGSISWKLL